MTALTLLITGTAFAHPDHGPRRADSGFDDGGYELGSRSGKSQPVPDDPERGFLPARQENVTLVGEEAVTNPDGSGDVEGRVTDVFAFDHPDLAAGEQSYAYLGAFFQFDDEGTRSCDSTGVHVMDINDLENPTEVLDSFIPADPNNYVGEGVQVIRIGDRDVLIHQNETCDTTTEDRTTPEGGISLWDVTNPLAPESITAHVGDTTVGEGEAPLPNDQSARTVHSFYAWQPDADTTYAVLVDNEELTDVDILDISDPENPVLINDTLDLDDQFGVSQEEPDNLTQVFSHDFDVVQAPDGRWILIANYWDGGYVLLDVTDPTPGNVTLIQETDFEQLDPERLERGQEVAPEGNAHQAELSPDLEFLVGTDEDFGPFRQFATLDDGTEFLAGSGDGTTQVTPEEGFDTATFREESGSDADLVFLGRGCDADGGVIPPAETSTVALIERGVCTFTEKVANAEEAGYDAVIIVNSSVPGNCSSVINMAVEGDIPAFFIGRDTGFALFGEPYDEEACQMGDQPFPAEVGEGSIQGFDIQLIFEGWGYVRLYDVDIDADGATIDETVDTYAIEESQDEDFATGFGDLSVHEVAIDPDRVPSATETGLAYFSYYAGGFRVVEYGPNGFEEVGVFVDEGGSNFWGVEVYDRGDERYILASDRDKGLFVFQFEEEEEQPQPGGDSVTRLAGAGRVETAIEISQAGFEDGAAGAVVLSRSDLFPDALSGSPLAISEDAPLLLTASEGLDDIVADEIERVLPPNGTVHLLGGTAALSQQAEDDVVALGYTIERYDGVDRFATARLIAEEGLDSPDTVLIANGRDFPDAVSAGAAGGVADAAVLLSGVDARNSETDRYLAAGPRTTFAIGGPAAAAYPDAEPVFGATRFETAVFVAQQFFPDPQVAGLATGGEFADALAGGAFVGRLGGPLLLTGTDGLPELVQDYLEANAGSIDEAFVFGGTNAISDVVVDEVEEAID